MLAELHAALLDRIATVSPNVAVGDFGNAVAFWTERIEFGTDSPLEYGDWTLVTGFEGHVVGEIVAELADSIGPELLASLFSKRLRVDPHRVNPQESGPYAFALIAEMLSREDGAVEGLNVLVAQLRFRVAGGIYRHDPAPPLPEPAPPEEPGIQEVQHG